MKFYRAIYVQILVLKGLNDIYLFLSAWVVGFGFQVAGQVVTKPVMGFFSFFSFYTAQQQQNKTKEKRREVRFLVATGGGCDGWTAARAVGESDGAPVVG